MLLLDLGIYICLLHTAHGQMDEILLDLNAPDNTTINITSEYFDMDMVIFLSNMTEYFTLNGTVGILMTEMYIIVTVLHEFELS